MTITDFAQAHDLAQALERFFEELKHDEPVGPEEGLTEDEVCKVVVFSRALSATLDDVRRRTSGFGLLEVLIAMSLSLVVLSGLMALIGASSLHVKRVDQVMQTQQDARSRLERTVWDPCHPATGVTVTWGDINGNGEALAHVETSYLGHILSTDLARIPCVE